MSIYSSFSTFRLFHPKPLPGIRNNAICIYLAMSGIVDIVGLSVDYWIRGLFALTGFITKAVALCYEEVFRSVGLCSIHFVSSCCFQFEKPTLT